MEFTFSIARLLFQTNFAPVFSVIILIAFIKTNNSFPDNINRCFLVACAVSLVLTASDDLRFITAHMASPTIFRYISAGVGYAARPTILFLISKIAGRFNRRKNLFFVIPLLFCIFISIVSIFPMGKGIMFSFTAENKFIRGPLGFLSHIVCLLYAFQIIFYSIKNTNNSKFEPIVVIIMGIAATTATVMENRYKFDFMLSQVLISSIIFYYFFLHTQTYKRDTLTHFLNRRCFYLEINHQLKNKIILLSMDLNNLKFYNDTLGHSAGDRALKVSAEIMTDIFSKYAKLYRTGGDEFMAIFTKQELAFVEKLVDEFQAALLATEYRVACGIANYTPGDDIEKIITLCDERMYSHKVKLKNSDSFKKI